MPSCIVPFLVVAVALAAVSPTAASAQSIRWGDCDAAVPRARCGTLTVPEARDRPGGRTIDLAVAVVAAREGPAGEDPVLVLLGGPGDAGIDRLRGVAAGLAHLGRTRDLVVVDQRGTGRSAPLHCAFGSDDDPQSYLDAFLPTAAARACRLRLQPDADLARYRTRDFVADLEALRTALGVRRWNLHARSYGTRVALHYLQRHPERVRAAILHGPVPPELTMPLTVGADADGALDRLAADCRADAGCAAAFPDFRAEVDAIARRLASEPARVTIPGAAAGRPRSLTLSRNTFGEIVRTMLYTPAGASALPLAIHEAHRGDYLALVLAGLGPRRALASSGSVGLYLAVTCAEDVARVELAAAIASNRATTMGDARARQHLAACERWPTRPDGEEWPRAAPIEVPVLMLVGETDPATPPHWAKVAMRGVANGRLLVVPEGGHGLDGMRGGDCLARVQAAFVAEPVPDALDATCVQTMRRPPFVLRR